MSPDDPPPRASDADDPPSPGDRPPSPERDALEDARRASQRRDPGSIEALRERTSVGHMSDEHWTRARADLNSDALDYLRQRNEAPGVADADQSPRNSYCMECDGVLPLEYDSRKPAERKKLRCPHCGAELERNIKRMFNWVEMDQVPDSDLAALAPFLIGGLILIALFLWLVL